MLELKKTQSRTIAKSSDGEFKYELENLYELSPKLSSMILQSAKACLIRDYQLREGQKEVTVISIEECAGKIVEKMERKKVRLTIDNGIDDIEIKQEFGRIELRRKKIERITEEALEQEGVLSQEDLSKYLSCTVRTIQRDIGAMKKEGIGIITRGSLHNIGRGQTHKVKIIEMYLEGKTYSEIKLKTRHSVGAIKRYIENFVKVSLSQKRKIYRTKDISSVTGLSETLVKQYLEIIRRAKRDKLKKENFELLLERSGYRPELKKRISPYLQPQAAMTGGLS
jgi:hypothetical protein